MRNFFDSLLEDWKELRKKLSFEDRLIEIIQRETQKESKKEWDKTRTEHPRAVGKYHICIWCPKRIRERNWDRRTI